MISLKKISFGGVLEEFPPLTAPEGGLDLLRQSQVSLSALAAKFVAVLSPRELRTSSRKESKRVKNTLFTAIFEKGKYEVRKMLGDLRVGET
jgi:hypothetical protein